MISCFAGFVPAFLKKTAVYLRKFFSDDKDRCVCKTDDLHKVFTKLIEAGRCT